MQHRLLCLIVLATGFFVTEVTHALQVISPSTAPNTHRRNMAAVGEQTRTLEPSLRLVNVMNAVIPFNVIGSEFEEPLRAVARKFIAGATKETVEGLEALREQRPEIPPAPVLVANMLFAAGKQDQCRQWLEKAVVEDPDHPSAFLGFARFAVVEKRITDASVMLEKINQLIEGGSWTEEQENLFRVEYLDIQSDVFVNRQQLPEARETLSELRILLPNNGKIAIRLAQIEFDLENIDASLQYLRDAAKLNESIRKPEIIIGEWFLRKKNPEESAKWINYAATEYPQDVAVQIDFGRWLLQNEEFEKAQAAISKAAQLGGDEYVVGYMKGQLAFAQRNYDNAELHFEQLLKNKPGDADATNMLALSLIESAEEGKHDRALELAMMNQRMYPQSPTAAATLGWIYFRTGKIAEAEQAFRAIVASKNVAPVAAYYLATILEQRGDLAGASNLLQQAISSQEYFMFRNAAEELLEAVKAKLNPSGASSTGQSEDAESNQLPVEFLPLSPGPCNGIKMVPRKNR